MTRRQPTFTRAIVRSPAPNFAEGLTTAGLGPPNYRIALHQHAAYCDALEACGLKLIKLEPDPEHPDSTFVEDTAVIAVRDGQEDLTAEDAGVNFVCNSAILTRPGAPCRLGEVQSMRVTLAEMFSELAEIKSPGTLDGGDVCQAGNHFFIGLSRRTNRSGAEQLAGFLTEAGYTSSLVNINEVGPESVRATSSLLHLKSGIAYLGENRLVIVKELADRAVFRDYQILRVSGSDEYAANC